MQLLACLLFVTHDYSDKSGYYVHHYKTVACDVTAAEPISGDIAEHGGF